MESSLGPELRFSVLSAFNDPDDGFKKMLTILNGSFHTEDCFNEPKVDTLLNGLARLFSCRYYPWTEDRRTEEERDKQRQDLEAFDKFDRTFETLLGEESSWKIPVGPEVQPVETWRPIRWVKQSKTMRNFRLRGYWPTARIQTAGIVRVSRPYPSQRLTPVTSISFRCGTEHVSLALGPHLHDQEPGLSVIPFGADTPIRWLGREVWFRIHNATR